LGNFVEVKVVYLDVEEDNFPKVNYIVIELLINIYKWRVIKNKN